MECDGVERNAASEEISAYEWPARACLGSFVAPVLEAAELTEKTLQAMRVLFASFNMLHVEPAERGWKPIVKIDEGFVACKAFLQALARASDLLGIRPQSRAYRSQFTKNYKALFPDHRRHYRVDVLEASQEGYSIIYVNGERYDFHTTVIERGTSFREAWCRTLDALNTMQHVDLSASPFWRSELVPVLVELDSKWAAFEEEYILELIQIERKARRYVMDVIFLENQLLYLDGAVASLVSQGNANQTAHLRVWQQWQSCRRQYVKNVFRLNAVANYRRKGHANLDLGVLEASENIIKTSESEPGHIYSAVEHMAAECVTSFNDFRGHINELGQSPERVDPHLGNNHVLVSHLCRLEETWELAQKYLRDMQRLRDLLSLIEFISAIVSTEKTIHLRAGSQAYKCTTAANNKSPRTPKRCSTGNASTSAGLLPSRPPFPHTNRNRRKQQETRIPTTSSTDSEASETLEHRVVNCDVGAFLALPRFVCLYYLLDPIHRLHLFRPFLPSLFSEEAADSLNPAELGDEECSSSPLTPLSPLNSNQESEGHASAPSVLSRAGLAREAENQQGTPAACASPHALESKPQNEEIESCASSQPVNGEAGGEETSFAQQAAAAEAAWVSKRYQQRHQRLEISQFDSSSTTFTTRDSTQKQIESLTSAQASSLLSLSLSASLQEIESDGITAEGNQHPRGTASTAPSPRTAYPSQASLKHSAAIGDGRQFGRERVLPCHSESDWYSSVPPPFSSADKVGGPRCCWLVLSKVPPSLRSMVRSWQKIQQWLQTAGLEGRAEPWLCIVARLSDTGVFETLMQSLIHTKVAGCRRYVEALFHAVESVSMAIQRSCPAEWNEFLQVLITSVTHQLAAQTAHPNSKKSSGPSNNAQATGGHAAGFTTAS